MKKGSRMILLQGFVHSSCTAVTSHFQFTELTEHHIVDYVEVKKNLLMSL